MVCLTPSALSHHLLSNAASLSTEPPRQTSVKCFCLGLHYCDVIMGAIESQITSLMIVYSIVYSDADQRKHQSSASLAFVWGIHRGPVNSPHQWPVTRKMFPFDDVIMNGLTMYSTFSPHTIFSIALVLHERHGASNHRQLACLFDISFRATTMKTDGFPSVWPRASHVEKCFMPRNHHVNMMARGDLQMHSL